MLRLISVCLLFAAASLMPQAQPSTPQGAPGQPISLYSDVRAYGTGDLLTVILAERTSARRSSESSGSAQRQISGAGNGSVGGFFGIDAQVGGQRAADSRTTQSDLLSGTITARVIEVDASGNLVIEGERRLNVDGDVHLMTVSGLVRPADVGPSNTVLSYQIAGADVAYQQEGSGPKFFQGKFLTLVGTAVVVVGVVLLGSAASSATQ